MNNGKILIVDDEANIIHILTENLEREGYEVISAEDGEAGLELALKENPDLVILDCMLPKLDGFDVCRNIRLKDQSVPIMMLTAKISEIDKVLGLELGADDYITKPFGIRELTARVKALLRRSNIKTSQDSEDSGMPVRITIGDLEIDREAYQVRLAGEPVNLTVREFELVSFLAHNAGQVFTREVLLEKVWGFEYFGDVRTVDVTIRRTREKLEPNQENYRYILTKRGVGYYFNREL